MKIIRPYFRIATPGTREQGIDALRSIEYFARVSHRSEEMQTPESYDRFLRAVVVGKGDWSVTEHAFATVVFRVDRGCTHEIVRHRLFSYTQESTRFVNYGKREIEFVEPEWSEAGQAQGTPYYTWSHAMFQAEQDYLDLLKQGQPPQAARSVLPNATAATLVMTGNLRSWKYFLQARTTRETHPDLRRVVIPLLKDFQERIPILYEDVIPNEKQSIAFSKPR